MKRRNFLKVTALSGVGAASGLAAPAIAQGKRELKMVTSWPKNLPGLGVGAERLAEKIGALTDGQLTVKVYAGGELVPPFEAFDAVSSGTADLYHSAAFLYQGKSKAFAFFTTVPFGLTSDESKGWITFGGGQELWDDLAGQYNLKPFMVGNAGVSMFGWSAKEITTLDDLQGFKYRLPGIGGEVLRRLGVTVTNIPPAEIMAAFQSGAIDGTEWASPFVDIGLGFYKAAKYYYYPGWHEPGTMLDCSINLDVWKGLTEQQRQAIHAATAWEDDVMRAEFAARNGVALKSLVSDHGVEIKKLPDEVLKALAESSKEVLAEFGQSDEGTKRIYESYIAFQEQAVPWSNISDLAYMEARRHLFS